MPPSPDFYQTPSAETLAAAQAWKESLSGISQFACKVTLPEGETILGELQISLVDFGMGTIRIPTLAEKELFANNQELFKGTKTTKAEYQKLGLDVDINYQHGDFVCSTVACGRNANKATHIYELIFYRKDAENNGRFRDLVVGSKAEEKSRPLSAQGLATVIERDFGWKVEPLFKE